jgi:hypothetical protein
VIAAPVSHRRAVGPRATEIFVAGPRARDRGDGVLEDHLIAVARLEDEGELVERADETRDPLAVGEEDGDARVVLPGVVEEVVLDVQRTVFRVLNGVQ